MSADSPVLAGAQSDWRWCELCQGLWYSGSPTHGFCPRNGSAGHHNNGSLNYNLIFDAGAGSSGQNNWRWCDSCQGLWYNGNSTHGICPRNGNPGHHNNSSLDYNILFADNAGAGQTDWRWCKHCQGLWYNGTPTNGVCPRDGNSGHQSAVGAGNYKLQSI